MQSGWKSGIKQQPCQGLNTKNQQIQPFTGLQIIISTLYPEFHSGLFTFNHFRGYFLKGEFCPTPIKRMRCAKKTTISILETVQKEDAIVMISELL